MAEGVSFYTSDDNSLQFGQHSYKQGKIIKPHRHQTVKVEFFDSPQEVLYIEKGKVRVFFYSDDDKQFDQRDISTGDTILLKQGGHSFEFLEETKMLEVKQGPYNAQSTIRFEGKRS